MARKRLHYEIEEIDKVDNKIESATIHGLVTSLSPLKKGRTASFFDGTLSDKSGKMRIVGFNADHQKVMKEFMNKKEPVQLTDCQIKPARRGSDMEIMFKGTTKLHPSPKKFDISTFHFGGDGPAEINLAQLQSFNDYDRVTVNIKVLTATNPTEVSTGKKKQEVTVADSSGVCIVTLWEENIGKLDQNQSYTLKSFLVRDFCGKSLTMGREGSEIRQIPDIGEVSKDDTGRKLQTITNATIIGVLQLDSYRSCFRCKARVDPISPPLGRCSKSECNMLQRFDICTSHTSAKLLFLSENETYSLYAYGQTVTNLVSNDEVTDTALLKVATLSTVTYDANNIITTFEV